MSDIGERIKARRLELEMTQQELADKVGYKSRSAINKIELGVNDVSVDMMQAFADALKTTVRYLMDIEKGSEYYLNPDTAQIAQRIYEDKELRALFDAAADASPEDLQTIHTMLKALKAKER